MTIDELKIAYKVVSKIMNEDKLTKDTSFVRVKNYISTKISDIIVEDKNDQI